MQLTLENPDFRYFLRGVERRRGIGSTSAAWPAASSCRPIDLVEDWRPRSLAELDARRPRALLALSPAVVLLGTGARQAFPPAAVMAACLTRGIGIEVMDNAAAARTFNVLATEARRVVAGFLL